MPNARAKTVTQPLTIEALTDDAGSTLTVRGVKELVDLGDGIYAIKIDPAAKASHADIRDFQQQVARGQAASHQNAIALTALRGQAMAARARQVQDGELLEAAELWSRLGVTRQAVSKQVKQQKMFAIDGASGQKLYPAFFADPRFSKAVLRQVTRALGELPGSGKWQFFTTGKVSLAGKTPLEAIMEGRIDKVLAAAAAFRGRE